MAPIRRYLRISKYSVLECRIYLDNPALAETWLLNPRNPILPRVIESVRPLVLPKLREENERSKAKSKSSKKKGLKDVVVEDDFEVSIFLTETTTRHSLLTKHKHLRDMGRKDLQSNSQKMTGDAGEMPIEVDDGPVLRREESDEDTINLQDLPVAVEQEPLAEPDEPLFVEQDNGPLRSKRGRPTFDTSKSPPNSSSPGLEPLSKRRKDTEFSEVADGEDDKKKMAMDTSYDGFSIYGRVLCLIVRRKETGKKKSPAVSGGQAMMEDWIVSTQMQPQDDDRI